MVGSGRDLELEEGEISRREKVLEFDWIGILVELSGEQIHALVEYGKKVGVINPRKRWMDVIDLEEVIGDVLKHIIETKDWNAPLRPDEAETLYYTYYTD